MTRARRTIWTALLLTGLCLAPQASWAVDAKLLPEKTEVVVRVNLKQILNSELGKSKNVQDVVKEVNAIFGMVPGNEQALKYLQKMGLDPARDLTALTLAHPASKNVEDVFIVLEGSFEPAKIEATARDAVKDYGNNLAITRLNDVTVFEIKTEQGNGYVGLLGKKTIVITGSQNAMKEAIVRSLGNKQAELQKDVAELLKTMNDKQSLSFVASSRAMAGLNDGGGIGAALPALDGGLSGSVTFGKDVTFQLGLSAKDKAAARDLVEKGNGVLLGVRFLVNQQAKQNPQITPVVDVVNSLRLFNVGNNAVLEGEVTYEALQQMFKNLGDQFKGK